MINDLDELKNLNLTSAVRKSKNELYMYCRKAPKCLEFVAIVTSKKVESKKKEKLIGFLKVF